MTTSEPATQRDEHGVNLFFVLVLHLGVGFFWLFALGGIVTIAFSEGIGIAWALCAAATWIIDATRIVGARFDAGRAWSLTFLWWLKSFIAPLALGYEGLKLLSQDEPQREVARPAPPSVPPTTPPPPAPAVDVNSRLDDFARRLAALEGELRELRRLASGPVPAAPAVEPPIVQAPVPPPPPPAPTPPAPKPAAPPPREPAPPRPVAKPKPPEQPPRGPSFWDREISFEDLFGAKALAWAGGVVTLLGIVFFFVLAVNRGWIGPVERVGLGALASLLVFGAGLWLRRAYGPVYSALAAAGAGIAGGYATLLAATALYELLPRGVALLLAAAIAGVATATALAWSSEILAGLGLIGATLAPAAIALQDGEWSAVGTAFVAIMFAGTATVALYQRWERLLAVGLLASAPQVAGLVAQGDVTDWGAVSVAAAVWLLYLGAAIALQLRLDRAALTSLPTTLVLVGGLLAGLSSVHLFEGKDEGWVLLGIAGVKALAAAALFPRMRQRDLSAFLGAVALALAAVAVAIILTGPALTIAWAAEAAVLAWLARRADEVRYQIAALAYLAAASVHALFWETPLEQLYRPSEDPASGVVALLAVMVGAAIFARYTGAWEGERRSGGVFALVAPLVNAFRRAQALWRWVAGWTTGLAALYAASLGVLQLGQWLALDDDESIRSGFDWAHVGVTGLWALAGVAAVVVGHRWSLHRLRIGGLVWLAAVPLQVVLFDATLGPDQRTASFLVLAAAAAVLALVGRRLDEPWAQVAALGYLAPVLLHAVYDVPPEQLYRVAERPAEDVVSVIALALAAGIAAFSLRVSGRGENAARVFDASQAGFQGTAGWVAWLAGVYAASLGVLELGQWIALDDADSILRAFDWSHVGVTGLWGLAALATLAIGHARGSLQIRIGGLAALGLVLLQAIFFDITLDQDPRGFAFLVASAALVLGALFDRLSVREEPAFAVVAGLLLLSVGLGVAGLLELTSGAWEGWSLLALAAGYCAVSALVFRRDRDLSTALWAPALLVAGYAATILLSGTWLVLAWSAAAAALAVLAAGADERRLELASLGFLVFALGHTLGFEAPPADLFDANAHPENGVPALLFVIGAAITLGFFSRGTPRQRWFAFAASAVLAIYAGSLAILGLAQALGGASVATDFQRGHSGVSAFWGAIGLVALYVGLRRGTRWLRLAGFLLFGLSLGKLFLYDLSNLSSVTRALSFLAVGAVLLFAGFLVQRLGSERPEAA